MPPPHPSSASKGKARALSKQQSTPAQAQRETNCSTCVLDPFQARGGSTLDKAARVSIVGFRPFQTVSRSRSNVQSQGSLAIAIRAHRTPALDRNIKKSRLARKTSSYAYPKSGGRRTPLASSGPPAIARVFPDGRDENSNQNGGGAGGGQRQ